jgi:branched-chain amino acid transport system substrate-binding protein
MRKTLAFGILAAAVLGVAATSAAVGGTARSTVSCGSEATIGYFGPTTGPAASIGQELRNWSIFYARRWNKAGRRPQIKLIEGDTQFDPKEVSTIATQFASNRNLLAVIGPGASQEVLAAKPIFKRAGMAYIAASATRTTLTDGTNPTFFRISAPDAVQARSTTDFMLKRLKVKEVFIVDDQSSYSVPLGDEVQRILRRARVDVERTSITQKQSDFSSVITDIPSGTDLVYMPIQLPSQMQLIGQQLREQGKRITLFGSDAGYSPDFKIVGSYFSTFGPDVRTFPAARPTVDAYFREFGKKAPLTTYGPLSYITGQVIVDAVARACRDDDATRAEVLRQVRRTNLKTSIIGQPVRFTRRGDRVGASFFTFQITRAGPKTVR